MRLVLVMLLLANTAQAAVRTAASLSRADISTQITASAPTGDTIILPVGVSSVADWNTGPLATSKQIYFQGAGGGLTILTNDGGDEFFIMSPSGIGAYGSSGIMFSNIHFGHPVSGGEISHIVIDEPHTNTMVLKCRFNCGSRVLYWTQRGYGLVNGNHFEDADVAIAVENKDVDEWALGLRIGTFQTMLVESNVFKIDEGVSMDEQVYGQDATRATARYNFVMSANNGATAPFMDGHGNWNIGVRGTHVYEVYFNVVSNYPGAFETLHLRGGCNLVWSNDFRGGGELFRFRNENKETNGEYDDTDELVDNHWWLNKFDGDMQESGAWNLADGNEYNIAGNSGGLVFIMNDTDAWVPSFTDATGWATSQSYVQQSGATNPTFRKHGSPSKLYRCKLSHTSDSSSEPGVGASWTTYWDLVSWHIYLRAPASGDPIYPYVPAGTHPFFAQSSPPTPTAPAPFAKIKGIKLTL